RRIRIGQRLASLAHLHSEGVGLLDQRIEEFVAGQPAAAYVRLDAGERILQFPVLDLLAEAVTSGVVGGGVRAHPIRVRLDEGGASALAGPLQRRRHHRMHGEDVVAVDAYAGESEALGAAVERDPRLTLGRLADREVVVLAEEDPR